jgi:hypothetical protein
VDEIEPIAKEAKRLIDGAIHQIDLEKKTIAI